MELILRLCDPTPTMLPTFTAYRYLVPTAFGASGRRIPAAIVIAVVVVIVAVLFLAVLLGGPEEPKGLSAHRLVIIGGGVDLLFRGGVDSIRRGVFLVAILRLILEQEPEVFSLGLGLVLLGDGPEVELLCIPMQRSQCFIRCSWIPLRRRLPTLRDGVDGRSREGGRRRRRGGGRVFEGVGVGGGRDRHGYWWRRNGVFCATWLWEEEGVCCEEEPIRGEIK